MTLITIDQLKYNEENSKTTITRADLRNGLNSYLEDLESSQVRNMQELIDFNFEHTDQELPLVFSFSRSWSRPFNSSIDAYASRSFSNSGGLAGPNQSEVVCHFFQKRIR